MNCWNWLCNRRLRRTLKNVHRCLHIWVIFDWPPAASMLRKKVLQQAMALIPNYPAALADLARIRIVRKQFAEAVTLLERRYQAVPRTENLYDLAEALELAGRQDESRRAFAEFETRSLDQSKAKDNSNRELVFYYADKVRMPARALEVAKQEYQWRHDVFTLDAYAWALHVNGKDAEARIQIETALAVGIRDCKSFSPCGRDCGKNGRYFSSGRLLEAVS